MYFNSFMIKRLTFFKIIAESLEKNSTQAEAQLHVKTQKEYTW